jgi:hypothetical protein
MDESMADAATERFKKQFGDLEEIFTKIRGAIWLYTPAPDFSSIKDEDVLLLFIVLRAVCRERITEIIDQPSVDCKVIYQRADLLRDTISEPRTVTALFYYDLSRNGLNSAPKLINSLHSLVKLDLNIFYTYGELLKRIEARPIGKKVFSQLADEGKTEQEAFLEVLKDLRLGPTRKKIGKVKSYHPEKFSNEDLQQEAKLGAWTYWTHVKAAIAEEMPLPKIPVPLPTERNALWRTVNPILAKVEGKAWADALLPILRGNWEKLPDKAYQTLKNLWQKQKAKKRSEVEWPYQQKSIDPEQETILQDEIKTIIEAAGQDLGPKAAEAFRQRLTVDSDKEAAKLAGITARTYRNYIKIIRKSFAPKKCL